MDSGAGAGGRENSAVGRKGPVRQMDSSVGSGGQDGSAVSKRGLTRKSSSASSLNTSGTQESSFEALNLSRVKSLKATVERHSDIISKLMLSSKESLEKRTTIESAFRACRDAFMEISTVFTYMLEERMSSNNLTVEDVKAVVEEVMEVTRGAADERRETARSYASVVGPSKTEVRVPGGTAIETQNTTSFLIVPDDGSSSKFASAQEIRETMSKVFRPADCGLRINKLTLMKSGGVRVVAQSPDLDKVRAHPGLAKAGLKIKTNDKLNPRLIVHGVPTDMTTEEIKEELVAQNLDDDVADQIKVVYRFKPKQDKRTSGCILEVSPEVRMTLLERGRVFLRYSACSMADHIRLVQCYKCLSFGHFAANCKDKSFCGHCAGSHETKDCKARNAQPKCINCVRLNGPQTDVAHSAFDSAKCPIMLRKIKDRTSFINYG